MKIFSLIIMITVFLAACNSKTNQSSSSDKLTEAEVKDFISAYDKMWSDRDTTAMKQAMAKNYIYFSSTGNTTTRDRIISWFSPSEKYRVDTAVRTEISITINDNTSVVSSRWVGNGSFDGEKFNDDQRCSLIIQKVNGELKLISEHCTQIVNQH